MNEKCPICGEHADKQIVFRDCHTDEITTVAYFCKRCEKAISEAVIKAIDKRTKEVWGRGITKDTVGGKK